MKYKIVLAHRLVVANRATTETLPFILGTERTVYWDTESGDVKDIWDGYLRMREDQKTQDLSDNDWRKIVVPEDAGEMNQFREAVNIFMRYVSDVDVGDVCPAVKSIEVGSRPTVVGIAVKVKKRAPMQELQSVKISVDSGIDGDHRGKRGFSDSRQVTVLSLQQWEQACNSIGAQLPWHTRRANICIDGLTFGSRDVGKLLLLGDVVLQITGETSPCKRMDEAYDGLRVALDWDWRGGVTCRVIKGGVVQVSSPAILV